MTLAARPVTDEDTVTTTVASDREALARAVAMAGASGPASSPNPGVGCVIVQDTRVVGEGITAPVGGPHAEAAALRDAGSDAAGATLATTLEPCTHHGRTPPCTDAILEAGVRRVVIAHPDVNPLAAGGAALLRAAGVEVVGPLEVTDPLRASVAVQLEGFLMAVTEGRPHVTLKLAQTTDGRLGAPDGRRWLTGPVARTAVHRWRAERDAVLVGSGTVVTDDPQLDVRHVACTRQPRPVVLDARLRTSPTARVARPGAIVVTAPDTPVERRLALLERGVEVVEVPAGPAGGVELPAALAALADLGVTTVLAEPGATLAHALVAADLVDRLVLHVAVDLGTGAPIRAVPDPPGGPWAIERSGGAGRDLVLHLVPSARIARANPFPDPFTRPFDGPPVAVDQER